MNQPTCRRLSLNGMWSYQCLVQIVFYSFLRKTLDHQCGWWGLQSQFTQHPTTSERKTRGWFIVKILNLSLDTQDLDADFLASTNICVPHKPTNLNFWHTLASAMLKGIPRDCVHDSDCCLSHIVLDFLIHVEVHLQSWIGGLPLLGSDSLETSNTWTSGASHLTSENANDPAQTPPQDSSYHDHDHGCNYGYGCDYDCDPAPYLFATEKILCPVLFDQPSPEQNHMCGALEVQPVPTLCWPLDSLKKSDCDDGSNHLPHRSCHHYGCQCVKLA